MLAVRLLGRLPGWLWPALCAVLLIAAPQLGIGFAVERQITLAAILALLVSGLNLSLGYAGELALGGAAVYAVGAYVSGYLSLHGYRDILLQLVVSAAAALLVGMVTGIPGLRLGSWSLAMISFFLVLLVPDLVEIFPRQTGGSPGMSGIISTLFGQPISLDGYYVLVVVVMVAWFAFMRNLVTSRHGPALRVLRQSPVLAGSSGMSVYRLKLTAYALGSVPAGLAGALYANLDHYVSPTTFDFTLAVTILAASILGGSASVYGAAVGAAIMQFGPGQSTSFQQYTPLVYGAYLVIGGVLLSGGISGLCRRLMRRARYAIGSGPGAPGHPRARPVASGLAAPASRSLTTLEPVAGAKLSVRHASKRFSGLQALDDVSVSAAPGQVTAVIGPNGSGKTTLLNIICGFYRADAGEVTIGDSSPRLRPHRVARSGVARTFQTPLVPTGLTVAEAVAAGRYMFPYRSLLAAVLRLPGYRRARADDWQEARRMLDLVGLAEHGGEEATTLPLGGRRLLEVARALISRPAVLLLDEPASGLDEDEVEYLAALIETIRDAGSTVVLVEHNFGLVLRLADKIHVLARGRVLATGTPQEIERHSDVVREYLGSSADRLVAEPGGEGAQ